jgi:hypothetical protein
MWGMWALKRYEGVAPPATLLASLAGGGLRPGADPRFYGIIYVTITRA